MISYLLLNHMQRNQEFDPSNTNSEVIQSLNAVSKFSQIQVLPIDIDERLHFQSVELKKS